MANGDFKNVHLLWICFIITLFVLYPAGVLFSQTPGPLSKVHSRWDKASGCSNCHVSAGKIAPHKCLGCHEELALRIKEQRGYHGDKNEGCGDCHTEHQGSEARLVPLDTGDFDHRDTGYRLTGRHSRIKSCDKCHNPANSPPRKYSRSFFLKDNRCVACHYDAHRGNYPRCAECHTTIEWQVDIW